MEIPDLKLLTNPVKKANPISRHFFLWVVPLFLKGFKKDLTISDFYVPRTSDESEVLGDKLEKTWKLEQKNVEEGKRKMPRLWRALWSIFGGYYSSLLILYVFSEWVLRVVQVLCVQGLVRSFSPESDYEKRDQFLLAGGVILSSFLVTMTFHPMFHSGFVVAMRCRLACSSLIYRKMLKLNKSADSGGTTGGQVVNLLSNDVNRFDLNLLFFPFLFVAPVQLGIFIYLLWQELGPAPTFAGMGVVFIITVLQYWNGTYSTKYRRDIAARTDERGRTMGEIISSIRVIKMYAWEIPFTKLVRLLRRLEMKVIRKRAFLRGIYLSTFSSASKAIPFLTVMTYVLMDNQITADKMFFAVAIYNVVIQNMMYLIPTAISGIGEVSVALKRIEDFLLLEEVNNEGDDKETNNNENGNSKGTPVINLKNVSAGWGKDGDNLKEINISAVDKSLVIVAGPVGSGKTTLLHLLLREIKPKSGTLNISGRISYCPQESWIFTGTVRQNILFGEPFDEERYNKVTAAAALLDDFIQLDYGDMTLVGDRGTSLSGGQKARINLARCLYREADIYLLDDPLSSVDAKVSRHLFEKGIKEFLGEKLVILVTHQLQYLGSADHVVVLENGAILAQGSFTHLSESGIDFVKLMTADEGEIENEKVPEENKKLTKEPEQKVVKKDLDNQVKKTEVAATGEMSSSVYWDYFKAARTNFGVFSLAVLFVGAQVAITATEFWMSFWTNAEEEKKETGELPMSESNFLFIYGGLVFLVLLLNMFRAFGWFQLSYKISENLHNNMFLSVVHSPSKFFDDNPPGRIMNRFTKDMGQMDEILPPVFFETCIIFFQMAGVLGIVIYSKWIVAPPAVIVLIVLWMMRGVYIRTSRDIKRVEGITKSPVFSHAVSTLDGLTVVRALKAGPILAKQFDELQDYNTAAWFLFLCSSRCFQIWVEVVSVVFLAIVTLSFLVLPDSSEGGSVGLSVTAAMNLTTWFQFAMRQSAEVSNCMTAVERIMEYVDLPSEASLKSIKGNEPPKSWPSNGEITFENVSLIYEDEPVLKNLNFSIKAGEKVGVVGRTGAGKSSVIQALFRMTEPQGNILIDGVLISKIGLHDLRKGVSIIPQDPVLFRGTVRYNLDPFDEHQDEEIWTALTEVGLKENVSHLDYKVSDGGSNFSVGQKQLLCLARAVLRKNKIIILDEATANVDPRTDEFIQNTIRRKFATCTTITVAHRLHTIMDADRILVLDKGVVKEFDSPKNLLQNPDGLFSSMVNATGKASSDLLKSLAGKGNIISTSQVT